MSKLFGLYALIGGLSVGLLGCGGWGVDGNGDREDQARELSAFTRLRSDCELDVQLVQGELQSVTVSIDSNLQELVEMRVVDETLYLEVKDDLDEIVDGPHVLITVPELTAAKLAGSGAMTLQLDQPELPLDLFLSGSGSLRFDGATAAVGAYLDGSGDIRLEGETSDVEMILSGSGDIRGQHLVASSASIELSGSGSISANVRDSARVSLTGSGHIELYGDAAVDEYTNTGSGDVVRR